MIQCRTSSPMLHTTNFWAMLLWCLCFPVCVCFRSEQSTWDIVAISLLIYNHNIVTLSLWVAVFELYVRSPVKSSNKLRICISITFRTFRETSVIIENKFGKHAFCRTHSPISNQPSLDYFTITYFSLRNGSWIFPLEKMWQILYNMCTETEAGH